MSSSPENLRASAVFLTGMNLVCAGIGADGFGAAAVVVSLTAVATNLIDVRLNDLVSNLYYNADAARATTGPAYRASALRLGIGLYALSAPLIMLASAALIWIAAGRFTAAAIETQWLWLAAGAQAVSYFGSFFIFIQRFVADARRMAALQIASALINAFAMVGSVIARPGIDGYVTGLFISAAAIATLNAVFALRIAASAVPLFERRPRHGATIDRAVVFRFIAAGNVLGYVKLLHRSADVLLVAFFCADRDTGIYKLARSMTDALYAMSEAIGRVYQPRLLTLLQQGAHDEYRRLARSIAGIAAVVTLLVLAAVFVGVPPLASVLGWHDMPGLTATTAILTLPFFFVAGLQSWIWPAFVSMGRLGRCTFWGVVAVLIGQYTVGPLLVYATGAARPAWFGIGYLSFYVLSLLPLWRELVRQRHTFAWMAPEAAA